MFESGIFDGFFFMGPRPNDIFKQYTALTGVTPLPPVTISSKIQYFVRIFFLIQLWSIAYHQCRWNYNDEDDVRK